MMRPHDNTALRSTLTPADEDAEPVIFRRGHPDRHDPFFLADDDNMAEGAVHDRARQHFRDALETHEAQAGVDSAVYVNMAWRPDAEFRTRGVDPDVMLVRPAPPNAERIRSLRAWAPGHTAPLLAFEVVSKETRLKDYEIEQERYRLAKVRELIVFDPERLGPRREGGPFAVQVWRRLRNGRFVRRYAGEGPVESAVLGAWLIVEGLLLRIADDAEGKRPWPTSAERERGAKILAMVRADTEQKRAQDERERAEVERERAEAEHERAEVERERAEGERERAEVERAEKVSALERAEGERKRAEAERAQTVHLMARHVERRLGRGLTEAERSTLARRLETADVLAIDEEIAALADDALARWLRG